MLPRTRPRPGFWRLRRGRSSRATVSCPTPLNSRGESRSDPPYGLRVYRDSTKTAGRAEAFFPTETDRLPDRLTRSNAPKKRLPGSGPPCLVNELPCGCHDDLMYGYVGMADRPLQG